MDVLSPPPPKRRRRQEEDGESRRQQRPLGPEPGDGGGKAVAGAAADVDLLSSLHDDVLGSIITLLPTKDGARTQVLSWRWRPLWRSASAPLNVEATVTTSLTVDHRRASSSTSSAVFGALQAHPGPARRVSLTWLAHSDSFPMVDDLLLLRRFFCLDSLQEFELYYKPSPTPAAGGPRPPPPMASLLRFSRTLRVLTLCSAAEDPLFTFSYSRYGLVFPPEIMAALELPTLEQLTLKHVRISDAALHALLSRCPALQSLVLHKIEACHRVVITSPTLRSLAVSDCADVVIEDALMLERLIPREVWLGIRIQIVNAPRLKTLGYLCGKISEFEMGTMVFKGMVPAAGASSMIRTVKILALDSPRDQDAVIDILKCFPSLEKLYMELQHYGYSNNVKGNKLRNVRRHNVPVECLDTHLKVLELRNYRGRKSEMRLVRFFFANARVLESVKFMVPPYNYCKGKWVVNQRKKLLLNIKASRGARFHFELGDWLPSRVPMEHIHNLAIDDPFARSSCSCQYDHFK